MAPEFASFFRTLTTNLWFLNHGVRSFRNGLENDLETLKRIVQEIRDEFQEAEHTLICYEIDKLRLKQLKDVADRADDVLDAYHYEVLRSKMENQPDTRERKRKRGEEVRNLIHSFSSVIRQECTVRKISDGVKEICDIYDRILEASEYFRLEDAEEHPADGVRCCSSPPPTSSMVDKSRIFGRKTETAKVVRFLLSKNRRGNNVSVISILGKAGIGKTTLAQLACDVGKVENDFNPKCWVSVPPDFDATLLMKSILDAVTTTEPSSISEMGELQMTLKREFWKKKVLLVLDGVLQMERSCWESLVSSFADAEKVRIIVTTENEIVAEITESQKHHLDPLPYDECRLLFEHFALGGWDSTEKEKFTEIAAKIVSKCGGLPLAVKVLACLLRHDTRKDFWEDVLESDIWESDGDNGIMAALMFSYKHLPIHLKPLLLFCSMLPRSLGNLRKLFTMEITPTEIEESPESLCRLSKLQRVNLYGNWNMGHLPGEFTDLVSLHYLELRRTGIRRLPESIGKLPLSFIRFG